MSDQNKGDGEGKNPPGKGKGKPGGAKAKGGRIGGTNVGRVLRTAYDDALRESVPDDFLELLRKLD